MTDLYSPVDRQTFAEAFKYKQKDNLPESSF